MSLRTHYKLIEKIHEGLSTVVYRAQRKHDRETAIIKLLKANYPTQEDISRLRHEYEIAKCLNLEGIVRPYGLEKYRNGLALILEDSKGEALNQFLSDRQLTLKEFLAIAVQLADTLGKLHANKVIHKDIKLTNIIINPATLQVKVTDFSIATKLSRETPGFNHPTLLEGTLAYMSPEQTGRMNRSIDYRTDFYSLGITFYEILCGELPFTTTDPMELVHCHLAKQPVPPAEKITDRHQSKIQNGEIPKVVSDIVMKLLAKTAEDRYQSALGLKADLEECLNQLEQTDRISDFTPGQRDRSGQFIIPQKLYGREAQVAILMNAFDRVSEGSSEMMLVSGYSGIGKSCLVHEVHKPIVKARGYFIAGKFDQFKRNIPYAALIQSFQNLIWQVLAESPTKISEWRQKILNALGENVRVIIDVIPELEAIVGAKPEISQLGVHESQNRFNRVFQDFIRLFAAKAHPLVLFLDDLQWADSASLKLMQLLLTDTDSQYLLLIGAYRDNEVSPTHPLIQTQEKIRLSGVRVNQIILQPLSLGTVCQIVGDTLGESGSSLLTPPEEQRLVKNESCEIERWKLLAELIFSKTQGNPFFLTQLLTSLYIEKLLTFDFKSGQWLWDLQEIQTIGIADCSVIELMANNIKKLPVETQKVLKLAACIGNLFNLDILAIVNEKSVSETAFELWAGLQAGLILPMGPTAGKMPFSDRELEVSLRQKKDLRLSSTTYPISYKFLHDRVQQAAYSLIPESEKKATHLKIGQLLWQNTKPEEKNENIFALVNQLNYGTDLIQSQEEKDNLVQLNLMAGRKAKAAVAYEAATRYLNVAFSLLSEMSWETQYDLTLDLYLEAVELEYLNIDFDRANQLASLVLRNAKNFLDSLKIYELKIQFYNSQNQLQEALDTSSRVLEMLGISLEETLPSQIVVEDCYNLPTMTDPYKLAAMRILNTAIAPIFVLAPNLFPLVTFQMVNLCRNYGNSLQAPHAYVLYGLLLCFQGEVEAGFRFGQLAVSLVEELKAKELKSKVSLVFNGFIRHWKEDARMTLDPLLEGIQSGLETGDLEYAGYNAIHYCVYPLLVGDNLESVATKQNQYLEVLLKLKQEYPLLALKIWRQFLDRLVELPPSRGALHGEWFKEEQHLSDLVNSNNYSLLFWFHLAKTILLYLFKSPIQAVENAKIGANYEQAMNGMMYVAEHNFYYSLGLLALYPTASPTQQTEYLDRVSLHQEKMRNWAESAPSNYQHKYELVEAEKARVQGKVLAAMDAYDRAIAGAKEHGYLQEEALASELAAEFYFSLGKDKFAQLYLTQAYYAYVHWGAKAKAKDLEDRYPTFFADILYSEFRNLDIYRTSLSTTGENAAILDLSTVNKASLALAEEIVLDKLLDKLLKILMENAGATTSCLILENEGQLLVKATGSVEENEVKLWPLTPIETSQHLPISIINYVVMMREPIVLNNAATSGKFTHDAYIADRQVKSVLCTPVIHQGHLIGIIYLENNITSSAFTTQRLEVLNILSAQVSVSLKNAMLYEKLEITGQNLRQANEKLEDYSRTLEQKVAFRTFELQEKNKLLKEQAIQLKQALKELQVTQTQLIQTEKMSSLGQMVAGIAHEINNPINFIYGNLIHAGEYFQEFLKLIDLYRQQPHVITPEIQRQEESMDVEYLISDFPKLIESMQVGTDRIRQIVLSLRNFSRLDEATLKSVDIHEGIDSTLLLLQNRLKGKSELGSIEVIKEYGELPVVECYPSFLNQVFMNVLSNAVDAIEESLSPTSTVRLKEKGLLTKQKGQIRISTQLIKGNRVEIRIADNGQGMVEEVYRKIFDPFFTTKSVGSGTGLGLAIAYQIVVEKHRGQLTCISAPGQGAEFAIEIPLQQGTQDR